MRKLLGSALAYGALSTLFRVGGHLLLLPLVLTKLAPADQALWWLFLSLGNFANLADFGFGPAITRVYSYLWAGADDYDTHGVPAIAHNRPNFTRLAELNAAVRKLYFRLALGATALLGVVGSALLATPISRCPDPASRWFAWGVFLAAVGFAFAASHWLLACQGINRVKEGQAATLWGSIAYVVCGAVLLSAGYGLLSMVLATALRGGLQRVFCRRAYRLHTQSEALPQTQPHPRAGTAILTRLWPNAWKFGLLALGGYFVSNSALLICGQLFEPHITASFGLTHQVATLVANLAGLWLALKWPSITILRTQGRLLEMSQLFAARLGAMAYSHLLLACGIVWLGNDLLRLLGKSTELLATVPLAFFLLHYLQQATYVQFANLAFSTNTVPFYILSIVMGTLVLLSTATLAPWLGVWGLLLGPWIVETLGSTWIVTTRAFRTQSLPLPTFLRTALWPVPNITTSVTDANSR